jgi:hypothetical protein
MSAVDIKESAERLSASQGPATNKGESKTRGTRTVPPPVRKKVKFSSDSDDISITLSDLSLDEFPEIMVRNRFSKASEVDEN